jgi:hypothetical protein
MACTWDSDADCLNCELKGELNCKWDRRLLLRFYKIGSLALASGFSAFIFIGLVHSWIPLITYLVFWIFFFGFFEIRVLCSHCPYYADEGRTLHCLANHGTIKIWRYNPEPMNTYEKLGFLGGALFFMLFPIAAELHTFYTLLNFARDLNETIVVLTVLTVVSIIGGSIFLFGLITRICISCVNFSCPLNRVPRKIVDTYLKRNPIMKEAWENKGYTINLDT